MPPAVSPLFFAIVVIIVVLVQSPRVRGWTHGRVGAAASDSNRHPRRRRWRHDRHPDSTTSHPLEPLERRVQRFMSRHASWMPVFAALAILIVLLVGAQAYFGNFLTPRVLSSLLLDNAYLLILAVGMTFVILTGGIDLSVGAVLAFTGILGASLLREGVPAGRRDPGHAPRRRRDRPRSSACSSSTSTCSRSSPRSPACSPPAGWRSW